MLMSWRLLSSWWYTKLVTLRGRSPRQATAGYAGSRHTRHHHLSKSTAVVKPSFRNSAVMASQAVSGLNAAAANLDVIGSNIANSAYGFGRHDSLFSLLPFHGKVAVSSDFYRVRTPGEILDVAISKGGFSSTGGQQQRFGVLPAMTDNLSWIVWLWLYARFAADQVFSNRYAAIQRNEIRYVPSTRRQRTAPRRRCGST